MRKKQIVTQYMINKYCEDYGIEKSVAIKLRDIIEENILYSPKKHKSILDFSIDEYSEVENNYYKI